MDRFKDTAGESYLVNLLEILKKPFFGFSIFLVSFLDFIADENISSTSFDKQRESETAFKDPSEAKI